MFGELRVMTNLLEFLPQLGLPYCLHCVLSCTSCQCNIIPEGICQLVQLWFGLIGIQYVAVATC